MIDPLDRAITNLRQLHGFGMKSEAELRRVVVAVLEGVRPDVLAVLEARRDIYRTKFEERDPFADDCCNLRDLAAHGVEVMEYAEGAMTAAIDHLIREASGDGVG